jgi:tRNA pseudouridine38-40 synthase
VRLRLDLAYDGTAFSGWASQPGRRTVQGVVEAALQTLLRMPELRLVVAGRTDAGVHATGQVAHCDVPDSTEVAPSDLSDAVRRLAGLLPGDVRVRSLSSAPTGFDARFSALWRRYRYRISDAPYGAEPLERRDTVAWRRSLDEQRMQRAAEALLGLHEFAAFCRRRDGASTIRTLQQLDVRRTVHRLEIDVRADAFCHSMVRSLVGALAAVGEGGRPVDWPASLLGGARRSDHVVVAPAHGLTLVEVGYPADAALADRARQARAVRQPADRTDGPVGG